jgi:N-acetyl-anhydromuramyl-L-alanine amidase AmpD
MSGALLEQIAEFSKRYLARLKMPAESPWNHGQLGGGPEGILVHYTANSSLKHTLRWFMLRKFLARASAHFVIADGWPMDAFLMASDFPDLQELPCCIVQCVPPDKWAWHARGLSPDYIGIEIVNRGEVRLTPDGSWVWWPSDWTQSYDGPTPVKINGKHWQPITTMQTMTAIELGRSLVQAYPSIAIDQILGHEHVQADKTDPGPTFPLTGYRNAVFSSNPLERQEWWRTYLIRPAHYERDRQYHITAEAIKRANLPPPEDPEDVHEVYWRLTDKTQREQWWMPALDLLGYVVPSKKSVMIFQRMMGLEVDGIVGRYTGRAILKRLRSRGVGHA